MAKLNILIIYDELEIELKQNELNFKLGIYSQMSNN